MSDYYVRKFLNKKKGMAAIELTGERSTKGESKYFTEARVALTDCQRQVTLDFYMDGKYSKSDIPDTLKKLDILIDELTKFRVWLHENNPNNS
jgi:hypothetical protein